MDEVVIDLSFKSWRVMLTVIEVHDFPVKCEINWLGITFKQFIKLL